MRIGLGIGLNNTLFKEGGGGGNVAPSNVTAPVISGSTSLGSVLNTTNGTWSGVPNTFIYSYQWMRNGVAILGANSNTYTTTLADSLADITCVVSANNCNIIPPSNTVAPVLSGTAVVGETLSVTNGAWDGTSPFTYTYNWFRGTTPIGTNINSYTLVQADAGNTSNIKCVVTATNEAGVSSADSNTVAQIMDANAQAYMQAVSIVNNSTVYFASTAQDRTGAQLYSYYNTFYIGLKNNSLFSKISLAYRERWGVANSNRVNMINPATFLMTYSGTLTYNITGTAGNGTNGIGNTGFIPDSNGLTVNNNHICLYSRTAAANPGSTQFYDCGSGTSSVLSAISTRRSTNLALYDSGAFSTNRSSYTSSDGSGIFIGKVNSDLTSKFFRNGTQVATRSITNGASLSNFAHYIHAFNENNTTVYYSPKEIAYYSIGLGLSDAEVTTYNNLIAQLNTDEGI